MYVYIYINFSVTYFDEFIYLFTISFYYPFFLIPLFLLLFSIWFWLVQTNTKLSEQCPIESSVLC